MIAVAYGGGIDSTAMVVEMLRRGEKIDFITFADTGAEKPHTYEYLKTFNNWLRARGLNITVVKYASMYSSLEDNCLRTFSLPSLAYGMKSCSEKWKIRPQDRFFNNNEAAKAEWKAGRKITKCIGYDMDEGHRAKIRTSEKYEYRYPLIEFGMEREDCIAAIQNAGLPVPGKSACFFCPSSRLPEIIDLRDRYPDLLARALHMEAQADLTSVKGLGRRFAWGEYLAGVPVKQADMPEQCGSCIG